MNSAIILIVFLMSSFVKNGDLKESGPQINNCDSLRVNLVGYFDKESILIEFENQKLERNVRRSGRYCFFFYLKFDHKLEDNEIIRISIYRTKNRPFSKRKLAFSIMRFNIDYPTPTIVSDKYKYAEYNMRDFWQEKGMGFDCSNSFWEPSSPGDTSRHMIDK